GAARARAGALGRSNVREGFVGYGESGHVANAGRAPGHGKIEPRRPWVQPRGSWLLRTRYSRPPVSTTASVLPKWPRTPAPRLASRGLWPSTGRPGPPVVAARAMRVQPPAATTSGRALSPDQVLEHDLLVLLGGPDRASKPDHLVEDLLPLLLRQVLGAYPLRGMAELAVLVEHHLSIIGRGHAREAKRCQHDGGQDHHKRRASPHRQILSLRYPRFGGTRERRDPPRLRWARPLEPDGRSNREEVVGDPLVLRRALVIGELPP